MTQRYKVVGACAHATVDTRDGRRRLLHLRGTLLPPGVPGEEIRHLLAVRLVAPVNGDAPAAPDDQPDDLSTDPVGDPPPGHDNPPGETATSPLPDGQETGQAPPAEPDPDVETKRAAARAKLPADGSKPDGRHGQPVWVEWLAQRGYDYDTLVKEDKPQLMNLANQL
jgi:hypothetical protein